MARSKNLTWGIAPSSAGTLLTAGGLLLSFSVVGANVGFPMAIAGLPLSIRGAVLLFKWKAEKQREAVSQGIREGVADFQRRHRESEPEIAENLLPKAIDRQDQDAKNTIDPGDSPRDELDSEDQETETTSEDEGDS